MLLSFLVQVALSALLVSASTPTPTKRTTIGSLPPNTFVMTKNSQFSFNGNPLKFVAVNAYWLPALNTNEDIENTLISIKTAGFSVVRVFGFNDVTSIPENGTWFQLVTNGTTSVNTGPNGLQKLDTVVQLCEKHGLLLQLSLTNNWNPMDNTANGISITPNTTVPRNALSNNYGGMDTYVRQFNSTPVLNHDDFYTSPSILNAFMNYTTQIVTRYVNSSAVLSWELANDPRCNSSISASLTCNTTTITLWHSQVATHIKSIDPNHLVSSGAAGFICMDCPKLFPVAPQPSPSATVGRRRARRVTKARMIQERKAAQKKYTKTQPRSLTGPSIRGRWKAPSTVAKRQSEQGTGPAFDGTSGVDSEDIANIPDIGYSTFQLFPDQNNYGPTDPNLPQFNNTVETGLNWIQTHAALAQMVDKPVVLTAFGLVTQGNAPNFVPFNSSQAPFGPDSPTSSPPAQQPFGVTDPQRDDAYSQWLQAGLQSGLGGMALYQWSQSNLTAGVGTAIAPSVTGTSESPTTTGTGVSPNDGYGIQGSGQGQVISTASAAEQQFGQGP